MSHSICSTSLLDFFNDSSIAAIGQDFPANNFESEDGSTGGRSSTTTAQVVSLVEDHVPHKTGAVCVGHPWYRMLKEESLIKIHQNTYTHSVKLYSGNDSSPNYSSCIRVQQNFDDKRKYIRCLWYVVVSLACILKLQKCIIFTHCIKCHAVRHGWLDSKE